MARLSKYLFPAAVLFSALLPCEMFSQDRFGIAGFDAIAGSPAGYLALVDRFVSDPASLTSDQFATVYYGFAFQSYYTPAIEGEEQMQQAIMADDYDLAYTLGMQILERAPVSLMTLYWTLFSAAELGYPAESTASLARRYNALVRVIALSGDGVAPATAFRVIYPGDMYAYTQMALELEIGEGYLWDDRWMEFRVKPKAGFRHSSIYFDTLAGGGDDQ